MKQLGLWFFLVIGFSSLDTHALTVEEAYVAIPHKRTVFDGSASILSKTQVESLKQLFALSDHGVVLRVEGIRALRAAQAQSLKKTLGDYSTLVSALSSLNVPPEIRPAQELVLQAVVMHQHFFESKLRDSATLSKRDVAYTADIQQASQKLHQAYDLLMKAFPAEPAVNKTSFFDYLCALDFL